MIENLLDHKCDIYHIRKEASSPGFGLPGATAYSYPDTPDACGVPCHFGRKYRDTLMSQRSPQNNYYARFKLVLPKGSDVRLNDKIVDCDTGLEYTAQVPKSVRGNHIAVFVKRTNEQEPL